MRLVVAAICVLTIGSGFAGAQEAPIANWQGMYLGVDGGTIIGNSEITALSNLVVQGASLNNGVGAVHAGYNWQNGHWVIGLETDVNKWFDSGDAGTVSVRGRAGLAYGSGLLFGTAGGEVVGVTLIRDATGQKIDQAIVGLVVGGGYELMVAKNVSLRAEGLYFQSPSQQFDFPAVGVIPAASATWDMSKTTVRAGITYHFN